jgi:hypothetical protein
MAFSLVLNSTDASAIVDSVWITPLTVAVSTEYRRFEGLGTGNQGTTPS